MAQTLVSVAPSFHIAGNEKSVATTEVITLAIDGMHCGACIRSVETELSQIPAW